MILAANITAPVLGLTIPSLSRINQRLSKEALTATPSLVTTDGLVKEARKILVARITASTSPKLCQVEVNLIRIIQADQSIAPDLITASQRLRKPALTATPSLVLMDGLVKEVSMILAARVTAFTSPNSCQVEVSMILTALEDQNTVLVSTPPASHNLTNQLPRQATTPPRSQGQSMTPTLSTSAGLETSSPAITDGAKAIPNQRVH